MEDKQLNFDQRLISVRRYSPTTITSRKHDENKTDHSFPVLPLLPLHRSELKSGPVSNPGSVPFLWEHTPGKPKEDKKQRNQNFDKPRIAPKLPPGRYQKTNQQNNIPQDESKETTKEESSVSGDSDESYVDALDTLSRNESFFLNCSLSALSGVDDLDVKVESFGSFSRDLQTRNLMMDRFLPAAKAMVSETPRYAPKKKAFVEEEQTQQLKRIVFNQEKPSLRYGPSFAKRYFDNQEEEEEKSDDDEYVEHGNFPAVCGLLPWFCLNPVPTMSLRSRANKTLPKSLSGGSCSETGNESKSAISEIKSSDNIQIAEVDENKIRLRKVHGYLETRNTSTYCEAPLSFLKEKEVLGIPEETMKSWIKDSESNKKGCKMFLEFLADQESSNELDSECSVVYLESRKNGFKTFQELLADQESFSELDSEGHVFEKTLHAESTQNVDSPNKISSLDTQDNRRVLEILTKTINQVNSIEDFKKLDSINSHVPPPLPNSPSDSWLRRIFPSLTTKKLA